jgi:hypothetical protein
MVVQMTDWEPDPPDPPNKQGQREALNHAGQWRLHMLHE